MAVHSSSGDADVFALAEILRDLGVPENAASLLLAHARMVARDALRLGLVSEADVDAVVSRHTADSMLFALVRAPLPGERWVDVGTGAGFPGVVLACAYPNVRFVLVEPMRRRASFLEYVADGLGLCNAEIVAARAEQLRQSGFDVGVARALAEPAEAFASLSALVRPGGEVIVAAGSEAVVPPGARDVRVNRRAVDSPGRFLVKRLGGETG